VTGKVSGKAFQRIAQHVESCHACSSALEACDHVSDPLLVQLKYASKDRAPAEPPVPEELLKAALACYHANDRPPHGPRQLGKFELVGELGSGSFGHVFRAPDPEPGRTVAVKMLRAGRLASREEVDRFLREARSAAQLKHPGLVSVYESGQTAE